jgi:hypothetical protein
MSSRAVEPDRDDDTSRLSDVEGAGLEHSQPDWSALPNLAETGGSPPQGMIPARSRRRTKLERASMRVLATGGIIGLGTALGAVLGSEGVAGWIIGLAVGLTSVMLAALLWSSRQL